MKRVRSTRSALRQRLSKYLTVALILSGISFLGGVTISAPAFAATPILQLDPGNSSSYPGSGTTWNDISGSGYHLGATPSSAFPTYSSANGGIFNFNASSLQGAATTTNFAAVTTFTAEAFFKLTAWPSADRTSIITTMYLNGGSAGIVGPTLYVSSSGVLDGGYFDGSYWRTAYDNYNTVPFAGYQLTQGAWYSAAVT